MNIEYPKLHGFLDVFEHLGDVGKTRRVDVGAVVTAHNPSAPSTLLCSLSASNNGTPEEGKYGNVKFLMVWDMSCNGIQIFQSIVLAHALPTCLVGSCPPSSLVLYSKSTAFNFCRHFSGLLLPSPLLAHRARTRMRRRPVLNMIMSRPLLKMGLFHTY